MTDEQAERMIAALERIAAALETIVEGDIEHEPSTKAFVKPVQEMTAVLERTEVRPPFPPIDARGLVVELPAVSSVNIPSRPVRYVWPKTTAEDGLLNARG